MHVQKCGKHCKQALSVHSDNHQHTAASPQDLLQLKSSLTAVEALFCDMGRSDGVEEIALGGAEKEVQGLDVARFSAAPAEAMAATLEYLRYSCVPACFGDLWGCCSDLLCPARLILTNGSCLS